jgi:hypothetical protein
LLRKEKELKDKEEQIRIEVEKEFFDKNHVPSSFTTI